MHSARLISSIIASVVAAPALAQHDGLPSDPVTDCAIIEAHGQMLEIFQLTPNCVINWDRFSIDFEHIVHFIQQQGSWRVLNRVTGAEFSRISGSMTADGLVYIVNPAGIFFDGTAVVDVGGIYAAAGDLTDSNFMMGVDRFENLSGAVTNRGHLSGNLVHLVGEMVANHGTIDAAGGVVSLLAGEDEIFLAVANGRLMVQIDGDDLLLGGAGAGGDPADAGPIGVENTGTILSAGGDVVLGAGDLYSLALVNSGTVDARGGSATLAAIGGTVRSNGIVRGDSVALSGDVVALSGSIEARDVVVDDRAVIEGDLAVTGDGTTTAEEVTFRSSVDEGANTVARLTVDSISTVFADGVGTSRALDTLTTTGVTTIAGNVRLDFATFGGATTIGGSLNADEDVHFLADATVKGDVDNDEKLLVDGNAIFGGDVRVADDMIVLGDTTIAGDLLGGEDLTIGGTTVIGGSVLVAEDAEFLGAAQISGNVSAGEDVEFGSTAFVGGNVLAFLDDAVFAGDAQVNGSVFAGDDVRFNGSALVFGNVTASGDDAVFEGDAFVGGTVEAFEDVRFGGDAIVGGSVLAGDDIEFRSTATVLGEVSAVDDARFRGLAFVGGSVTAGDDAEFFGAADIRGDLSAGDDVVFESTARLGGDVFAAGTATFRENVLLDGGADQSIEAGGRITATGEIIKETAGALELTAERFRLDGGLVEAEGDLLLNVVNRDGVAEVASIGAAGDLTLRSKTGEVLIGPGGRVTAVGDLTIEGATRVTVGDLNAFGDMRVTAPEIFLRTRAAGLLRDFRGVLIQDAGLDLVAGGRFFFSVAPQLLGSGAAPRLASALLDPDAVGTLSGFERRMLSYFTTGLFTRGQNLVDVVADGPTASQIAEALDGGNQPIVVLGGAVADSLTVAEIDALEDLGVLVEVALVESDEDPFDAPLNQPVLATAGHRVAESRLQPAAVREFLRRHESLHADRQRNGALFDGAWLIYASGVANPSGAGFARFLQTDERFVEAAQVLSELAGLLEAMGSIGLGPAELDAVRPGLVGDLMPSLVPASVLIDAAGS